MPSPTSASLRGVVVAHQTRLGRLSLDKPLDGTSNTEWDRQFEKVQGIWTAKKLEMSDLRRGSRTRLTLEELAYNVPMKDDDFTLLAIRRP